MRKVLPLALLLALGACAAPTHWEKPGVTEEVLAHDLTDCRQAAAQEAMRYPYGFGPPFGAYGRSSYFLWQQRQESDRFYAENRLREFCMRNKGYALMPIPKAPPNPG
jgi:hypothetical protein